MNIRLLQFTVLGSVMITLPTTMLGARVTSDLQPPQKRQATVTVAERLTQRKTPATRPADLRSPFDPADFDKPDPADPESIAAAQRARAAATKAGGPPAPALPVVPPTDRETLEKLAAQITPTGMMHLRGTPRLVIGNKPFEIGTRFTATYNNQDYELELVAIERTTFTLRYRGEEITRPIAKTVR
jgi:hypothetical protein